jgi:putative FmdB family regulatory protein
MPLYEYECRQCGVKSEALQKVADPPLESCGECGGELRRLLSAPAFQFKGSGWYVTDYARKGASGGGKDAAANGASSPSAGDGQAADTGSSVKSDQTRSGETKGSETKGSETKSGETKGGQAPGAATSGNT